MACYTGCNYAMMMITTTDDSEALTKPLIASGGGVGRLRFLV